MSNLKFTGASGRRPSTEARRYVYNVLATAIEEDLRDHGGWLLGGIEQEPDRRRVLRAARNIVEELRRKGSES